MSKPVTGLVQFGPSAGPDHTGDLDTNYGALQGAINDFGTYSNRLTDSSGAPNTITATTPASTTFALADGVIVQVKVANTTNSTAVNLNVNATGNVAVVNQDGTLPAAGAIVAGGVYQFQYEQVSNKWQIMLGAGGLLAANNSWTGTNTFSQQVTSTVNAGGSGSGFQVSAAQASIGLRATGGGADAKQWDFTAGLSANILEGRLLNDANSTAKDWLIVTRAGAAVSTIQFGNATDDPLVQAVDQGGSFWDLGWRDAPQNVQNGNYTFALSDRGKTVVKNAGAAATFTIPANASVAFPVGTVILINNQSNPNTLAITTDSLFWYPSGATGSRSLAQFTLAQLTKITSTAWALTGVGIS